MNLHKEELIDFLQQIWKRKVSLSPSYSRNALTRDLGVSSPYISNIFTGKKYLSNSNLETFSKILELDVQEKVKLKQLTFQTKNPNASLPEKKSNSSVKERTYIQGQEATKLIDKWFYIPILEFFNFPHSLDNSAKIATSFGITESQVMESIEVFKELDLIKKASNNEWVRKDRHQYLPMGKSRSFIREFIKI